ncbi:HAMP domain-containing protein, partial [Thalassospira xiamenensis]
MGTKFGVQSKLLISFALVGLMAVVSAVVGAVSFNKFGEALTTITEEKLPPIAAAQELATESAEIVAIAPRIVASNSTDEEQAIKEELDFRLLELVNKINEIEATGFMPEVIATINDNRIQLQDTLGQLHTVTQERFAISAEKAEKLGEFQDLAKRYGDTLKPVLSYTQNDIAQGNAYAQSLKDDPSAKYTASTEEVIENFIKMNDAISARSPVLEIERLGSSAANMIIASTTETQAVRLSIIPVRIRGTYADALAALESIGNERLKNFYVELIDKMSKLSVGDDSLPELRKRELAAAEESQRLVIQSGEFANAMRSSVAELVAALNSEVQDAAAQAKVVEKQSLTALAVVAAAAILISLIIYVVYVRGNLLRRLAGLQKTMVTLADGNLDIDVPVKGNDEITAMGRAVEVFKDNALKVRELQAEEERLN